MQSSIAQMEWISGGVKASLPISLSELSCGACLSTSCGAFIVCVTYRTFSLFHFTLYAMRIYALHFVRRGFVVTFPHSSHRIPYELLFCCRFGSCCLWCGRKSEDEDEHRILCNLIAIDLHNCLARKQESWVYLHRRLDVVCVCVCCGNVLSCYISDNFQTTEMCSAGVNYAFADLRLGGMSLFKLMCERVCAVCVCMWLY